MVFPPIFADFLQICFHFFSLACFQIFGSNFFSDFFLSNFFPTFSTNFFYNFYSTFFSSFLWLSRDLNAFFRCLNMYFFLQCSNSICSLLWKQALRKLSENSPKSRLSKSCLKTLWMQDLRKLSENSTKALWKQDFQKPSEHFLKVGSPKALRRFSEGPQKFLQKLSEKSPKAL